LGASLEASYLIGKTMKSRNISESLILLAAIEMVSVMHGENMVMTSSLFLCQETQFLGVLQYFQKIKLQLLD
jgi:hypothetical protein